MALERFYPEDFAPRRNYPEVDGADIPEAWPISYKDLRPYYRAAEALFRVRGGTDALRAEHLDPLLTPPPMTGASHELYEFLRAKGRHPYQLPMACERGPGCLGCQGFLCPNRCKNDSNQICLEPAIGDYGAQLLDVCRVIRLKATRDTVTGVECVRRGEEFTLRSALVVLAAGALATPDLLLRSASPDWPTGLANDSGLVGRNLMRHFVDLYAVSVKTQEGLGGGLKELAFNDHYLSDAGKFGTVQSFGALPPAAVLVAGMENDLRDSAVSWLSRAFKLAKPLLRMALDRQLSRALILASIMEDLPSPENRIAPAPGDQGLILEYHVRPRDQARIALCARNSVRTCNPTALW